MKRLMSTHVESCSIQRDDVSFLQKSNEFLQPGDVVLAPGVRPDRYRNRHLSSHFRRVLVSVLEYCYFFICLEKSLPSPAFSVSILVCKHLYATYLSAAVTF